MEDIIVSLEPAFHRIERFILWHNRYASLLAFLVGHCIFYAIARAGLRPFCAMMLVVLILHVLDCLKKKRSQVIPDGEQSLCELTQLVLRSYRHMCETHEKLNTLKTENRVKYSLLIIAVCLILAYIGVKISGFYVSYIAMLIIFILPAVVYHKLLPKLLQRLAPVLEQLDQSMEYKRRSLLDRKELLVPIDRTKSNDDDDDEDVRRLKSQQELLKKQKVESKRPILNVSEDEEAEETNELKAFEMNDESQTILDFRKRYQNETDTDDIALVPKANNVNDSSFDMLSDSSSSVADDDTSRLSELYASVVDKIDGKHRIKIKGDEVKIKGHAAKQRPRLRDVQFFPQNENDRDQYMSKPSAPPLINSAYDAQTTEPDLTSFDFLNDYDAKTQ